MKIERLNFKNGDSLKNFVLKQFEAAKTWRAGYESRWQRYYEIYRSYQEFLEDYWYRAQYFIPYPFALIEGMTPEIIESSIGANDFFGVEPRNNLERNEEITKKAELNYSMMVDEFNGDMDFFPAACDWIKGTIIYGTGFCKDGWKEEIKKFPKRLWKEAKTGAMEYEERFGKVFKSHPYMRTLAILDYYPDPFGRFGIDRELVPIEDIQKDEKYGMWNRGTYDELKGTSLPKDALQSWQKASDIRLGTDPATALTETVVELIHYWEADKTITIANRQVVARGLNFNPLPHQELPYNKLTDVPVFGEIYGVGEIEAMGDLPEINNMLRCADIDDILSSVNRQYVADKNKIEDQDLIINAPDVVIWSTDTNGAIAEVPRHPSTGQAARGAMLIQKDMEDVTQGYGYSRGATPERKETATAIVKLQQAAAKRNMLKVKMFRQTGLKTLLNHVLKNNLYFITQPKVIRLFGNAGMEWQQYNPWEAQGEMDIVIKGVTDIVAEKEKFLVFYEKAIQQPEVYNLFALNKRLAEVFGILAPEELFQKQPEIGAEGQPALPIPGMEGTI